MEQNEWNGWNVLAYKGIKYSGVEQCGAELNKIE